jgi:hypothetical protein
MPLTSYTPGEVLTASSLNANFTFAAATGLTLIKTQTIGTTVSDVVVPSAFSTTYDNYKVIIQGGASSTYCFLRLTLGATATGYYAGIWDFNYAGGTGATGQANTAFWLFGNGTTDGLSASGEILQPFASDQTTFNSSTPSLLTTGEMRQAGGWLNNTTSYTAFTITPSTGTLTGGTIYVYGYAKA